MGEIGPILLPRPSMSANNAGERGFALLIVLWSLVLIGLLTAHILTSGRTAMTLARNARDTAVARASADGAINEALYHVLANGSEHWAGDGSPHALGGGVTVRIKNLDDKINPNLASQGLLKGLFQAVGAPPAQAAQVAGAIIAWRSPAATKEKTADRLSAYRRAGLPYGPPGQKFVDLSTLGDVIGMTPDLLAKALPYLSLYQTGDPDRTRAGPVVRFALSLSGQAGARPGVFDGTVPVVEIDAQAGATGALVRRVAVVSLSSGNGAAAFQFLSLGGGR
jgi:general secretion pathway protein K